MAEAYKGHVERGIVIFDEGTPPLPEGTRVRILTESSPTVSGDEMASTRAWLLDLAREAESDTEAHRLPPDLAEHHDHYAHGKPKT